MKTSINMIIIRVNKNFKKIPDRMRNLDSDTNYYRWIDTDKIREVRLLPECLYEVIESKKFINKVQRDI